MNSIKERPKIIRGLCRFMILLLLVGTVLFIPDYRVQASVSKEMNSLAAGGDHSLALKTDGTVWAWGDNTDGRLGDGTTTHRYTPVQVQNLSGVTTLAAGHHHSLALKSDGTVWAWGRNIYGQLGDGTNVERHSPVQVPGLSGITAIAGGYGNSLALKSDGTVWAWGWNNYTPVQVMGLSGITALATSEYHILALKSDGTVWAWGANGNGELGDGTTTERQTPVQVTGLSGITALAAGYHHSLALKTDGTVWAWGDNVYGELGDGTTTERHTPVQVAGLSGITALAADGSNSLALKSDGTVWDWGWNWYGGLGDGTTIDRQVPVQVQGLNGVTALAAGWFYSLALKTDGTVCAWGWNASGRLGDGTTIDRYNPVQVHGPGDAGYLNLGSPDGSYVPVTNITITPPEPIYADNPFNLQYTVGPDNATYKNIKWTTNNPAVAACYNGTIIPRSVGTATITAQAIYGSAVAQCIVHVNYINYSGEKDILRKVALSTFVEKIDTNKIKNGSLKGKKVSDHAVGLTQMTMFNTDNTDVTWNEFFNRYIGSYTIRESVSYPDDGMQAMAFQDDNSDILIAYRGTDLAINDWGTDLAMLANLKQAQFDDALDFYNYVREKTEYQGKSISLTGHSLGGALATYVSAKSSDNVKADCFNPASGHMLVLTFGGNHPEKVPAYAGADVTPYTSYYNTDFDLYNNYVTKYNDKINHVEFTSNGYSHGFLNIDAWWEHELAAILTYNNGSFGLNSNLNKIIVGKTSINTLTFGTSKDDNITVDDGWAIPGWEHIIYSGNGNDVISGGNRDDCIIASGSGIKSFYGKNGGDTYIVDPLIDSNVTIYDPAGDDDILIKGAYLNDLTIKEDVNYFYIIYKYDSSGNPFIRVSEIRDGGWFSPKIQLKDTWGNSQDLSSGSFTPFSIQNYSLNSVVITEQSGETDYTLKSLRLNGEVTVKVYDQDGVLLGEYNNSANEIQIADYGYFYSVNADGQQYMDIDLLNGNYILKVTSSGSVDFIVYDPDSGGVTQYEKNGIDLSDGTTLVIDTDFLTAENKFTLEKDLTVTPLSASENVAAQQVSIDAIRVDLKTGVSTVVNAVVSPTNVLSSKVYWSVIQPDENSIIASAAVNDDGSATVTGVSAGSATLRATAVDGSGVYSEIPITVTQDLAPSYQATDAADAPYTSGNWTQAGPVIVTVDIPGGYDELYISDGNSSIQENSLTVNDPGQHKISFLARNSVTGEITATGIVQVNIDQAPPAIEGVSPEGVYYIDRLVQVSDDGLLDSVSVNGTSFTEDEVASGKWFADPGTYSISARDVTGRETVVDFEIKAKPDPDAATLNDLPTIQSIRDEFELVKYDLPAERIEILEQEIAAMETALTNILDIPVLVSIGITSPANKLVYTVGDALDLTGIVVTGSYSDDSTAVLPITAANVTGFNSSAPVPSQTLTVTVDGMTSTYIVSIVALTGYTLNGQVLVEGDDLTEGQTHYSGGATIELKQGEEIKYSTTSSEAADLTSNGSFSITGIAAGDYTVVLSKAGYLTRSFALTINSDLTLTTASNQYLNRIYLLAGDVVSDEYNVIAASDVNYILSKFNSNSTQVGFDPQVDIVKDQYNVISAADVNLILSNFNKNSTQYPVDIIY